MRTESQSVLREVLPPEERVIEAVVARYQRVAPAVTRFARSLAGNPDLNVRLGSQASATGDDIVIDPGVFQAAYARSAPVTPTEVALTSALHEVVHLMATDFDEKRPIPKSWLPEDRPRLAAEVRPIEAPHLLFADDDESDIEPPDEIADDVDHDQPVSLLAALDEAGGPPAIAVFLGLEDARQELKFFSLYPGARSVLSDLYRAAVPDAMRQARPLGQFALGAFLLVGGYFERGELERRLAPHVTAAIGEAADLFDDVAEAEDPWEVGTLSLDLLAIAKRHGLVTEVGASDNRTTQRAKLESDEAAISESMDAVRIVTPPLRDMDSYDQTRQAAMAVSAEHGHKGEVDQAGDPATDQLVRVSQAPTVYLPTGQRGKLVVSGFPDRFRTFGADGRALLIDTARQWEVAQRRVSGQLYPLFLANQRRGLRSGFDAGDLSPHAALLLGAGLYERMFERRDLPTRRSYGVSLLVDGSASMLQPRAIGGGRRTPWALAAATLGAWTLAQLCSELQIDFEVALFNRSFPAMGDDTETSFVERRAKATGGLRRTQGGAAERLTRTVNHYLVKPFDMRWRSAEDVMAGLFWTAAKPQEASRQVRVSPIDAPPISMFDKAANVDEFNVAYAGKRLAARQAATRILVVLADGMTRGSVQALAASVEAVEAGGAVVLGIGIGDETVQAAYARNQVVERPDELARAMVDGVRSTLYKTIAVMGGNTWWAHSSERVLNDQPRSMHA